MLDFLLIASGKGYRVLSKGQNLYVEGKRVYVKRTQLETLTKKVSWKLIPENLLETELHSTVK
jgi:hypothetical protein